MVDCWHKQLLVFTLSDPITCPSPTVWPTFLMILRLIVPFGERDLAPSVGDGLTHWQCRSVTVPMDSPIAAVGTLPSHTIQDYWRICKKRSLIFRFVEKIIFPSCHYPHRKCVPLLILVFLYKESTKTSLGLCQWPLSSRVSHPLSVSDARCAVSPATNATSMQANKLVAKCTWQT